MRESFINGMVETVIRLRQQVAHAAFQHRLGRFAAQHAARQGQFLLFAGMRRLTENTTINTKNIHRSNMLLGHPYGENFVYDEMMLTGPGEEGEAVAKADVPEHVRAAAKKAAGG